MTKSRIGCLAMRVGRGAERRDDKENFWGVKNMLTKLVMIVS